MVVGVRICEVVLRQLENQGDQDEELARDFPDFAVEGADLVPVVVDDFVLAYVFPCGDVLVDVEL